MPYVAKLAGQVFGHLTVVERCGTHRFGFAIWSCQCACGTITTATTGELRSGHKSSCGCQRYALKKLPPSEFVFRQIYRKYRESAQSRNLNFELTQSDFHAIVHKSCFYCGEPPNHVYRSKPSGQRPYTYMCNGVDRIDNNLGYTIENCVPCCENCNRAKLRMSATDFIALCHRVATLHPMDLAKPHTP